jgi:monothiol glutaredoxin
MTLSRRVLDPQHIHPAVQAFVASHHRDLVDAVAQAVQAHPVLVVGMGWNPFPKKARRLLDELGIAHHDVDIGNYLSEWRPRNALKMWTGWPTFPMVFVKGQLVGGYTDLKALADSGELHRLLQG